MIGFEHFHLSYKLNLIKMKFEVLCFHLFMYKKLQMKLALICVKFINHVTARVSILALFLVMEHMNIETATLHVHSSYR